MPTISARIHLTAALLGLSLVAPLADAEPAVTFLDGEAARRAIVNDARDPYFAQLQPLEMAAKTGAELGGTPDVQRAETRRRYQAAVRNFTDAEQQALRAYVAALAPLTRSYPRFARQPWKFVKVADDIEGGLPHTRDDFIVLSEDASASLVDMRRKLPADAALMRAGLLLAHEQVHVLQRVDAARFDSLYTRLFGFVRVPPFALTPELVANQVANPDGLACCWLFPRKGQAGRYILPWLVFEAGDNVRSMPADFRMLAVSVAADGAGYHVVRGADGRAQAGELLQDAEYVRAFPLTRNLYHPNEAAADLFAQLVMYDGLARERLPLEQRAALERDFAPLRRWFGEHFAE